MPYETAVRSTQFSQFEIHRQTKTATFQLSWISQNIWELILTRMPISLAWGSELAQPYHIKCPLTVRWDWTLKITLKSTINLYDRLKSIIIGTVRNIFDPISMRVGITGFMKIVTYQRNGRILHRGQFSNLKERTETHHELRQTERRRHRQKREVWNT